MWQTFINILSVIGIVAVAAFIIVFLSDLFISIVDGTNGIFFKRNKNKAKNDYDDDDDDRPTKRPILLNEPKEYKDDRAKREEYEEAPVRKPAPVSDAKYQEVEDIESEIDMEAARREEEMLRNQQRAREAVVDARRQEYAAPKTIITPAPQPVAQPAPQPKNDEEDIDQVIADISKQTLKEMEKAEELNKAKREQKELEEKQKAMEERNKEMEDRQKALEEEIERLKAQIAGDKATIEALEEQARKAPAEVEVKTVKVTASSKEEIQSRLEVLRQRLKENEKELAANRKEFVPLRRVNRTLESDKKKLRRKEAIVAKQKVVLYGVNNYVDIDEEKAKKLSEELDLLEGLRLSVQHCEEVMQKNKDRYPILERTNSFLVKSNADLKEDIATLEAQLAEIEANTDEDN
ncbi:MAG: hypothetical protein IJD48_01700 [Clostridia bacterium]|nr:hypothetical protein [Clostridia bacterium]